MGGMLRNQQQTEVSLQRRMPVDPGGARVITDVSAEAITFSYYNSGVLTTDAGQAAGTVVVAKLANMDVKNALGDVVGSHGDSSFSFGTGTVLTKEREFREILAEDAERNTANNGSAKAIAVTDGFDNGEWCLDYRTGTIYGVKATTGTSDTASYKAENTSIGASAEYNATPPTYADGGDATLQTDINGNQKVVEQNAFGGEDNSANRVITEERWQYALITTATTTTVFSGPGVVGEVYIQSGTMGNVTAYDNTSAAGDKFIDTATPAVGENMAGTKPLMVALGCTIVTAAATKVLIKYRTD